MLARVSKRVLRDTLMPNNGTLYKHARIIWYDGRVANAPEPILRFQTQISARFQRVHTTSNQLPTFPNHMRLHLPLMPQDILVIVCFKTNEICLKTRG